MRSNKYYNALIITILLLALMMLKCAGGSSGGGEAPVLSSGKVITSFVFDEDNNPGLSRDLTCDIVGTDITAIAPYGTDLSNLVASFTSTGQSVTVGGVEQESGETENDFTTDVIYTVTAADTSTQDYNVSVTIRSLRVCDGNYTIDNNDTAGDIDAVCDCTELTGYLHIDQTGLASLDGLENLESLGGDLEITDNANLTDLSGLGNL